MHLAILLASLAVAWLVWKAVLKLSTRSPLANLPGPQSTSWIAGNMQDINDRYKWDFVNDLDRNGGVSRMNGILGGDVVYVHDPQALQYIFHKDAASFDTPAVILDALNYIFGDALNSARGDVHRKQRRLVGPIFSTESLRQLTPIFFGVAETLRQALVTKLQDDPRDLDVYYYMGRTTLEVIGQGGLGTSLDQLTQEEVSHPLSDALRALMPAITKLGFVRFLTPFYKYLGPVSFRRWLVDVLPFQGLKEVAKIVDTMWSESKAIYNAKKDALLTGGFEELASQGKDITSIMLKINNAASDADRIAEDEIVAQMSVFLFAGTDTTTSVLSQMLQLLAEKPDIQDKLRSEIRQASALGAELSFEELHALPFLDAICRETLRRYPSVPFVFREPQQDVVLPLSEPVHGRDGQLISSIAVPKGTSMVLGVRSANVNRSVWGEDAMEWKPERWLPSVSKKVADAQVPGVYPNLATFVSGARHCIGWRFSELELKVVLFVLVDHFKFSPSDNHSEIFWNLAPARYPTTGKTSEKPALFLKVECIKQ